MRLKVGFNRHFHRSPYVALRLVVVIALIFPAFSAIAQPTINSTPVETGTYGTPYIYNVTTNPWINDVVISLGTVVPGITLIDHGNGTATLSGIPTNAGTFPVTINVADATIPLLQSEQNFDLNIAKATLVITADDKSRPYGDDNPTLTFSYSGFAAGDSETDLDAPKPAASTTATKFTNAGTVPITLSGGPDDNYNYQFHDATLTINKVALTATADDQSRAYGANNPTLTISYTGFANGETAGVIATEPTVSTTAVPSSSAGTYPISVSTALATDENYTFTPVAGTLTVTKVTLTATADNKTKVYGSVNPAFTISYSGFVNGDTETVLDPPPNRPTATTLATTTSNAGNYAITVSGGTNTNYTFNYAAGVLAVTKVSLTVTADAKSRVYGAANPPLTFSYAGFVGTDNASVIDSQPTVSTTATPSSHVSTYPIVLADGSDNNYDLVLGDNILTVTKATLTITAQDQSRAYGAVNPALTVSYSGFVNGDTQSILTTPVSVTTPAIATSPVGTYGIVPSAATADDYAINFVQGTLSVTKAVLTATADDNSRAYGASNPAFNVSYSGFLNGETVANIIPGTASAPSATATVNAGTTHAIIPAGASATNYSFVYVNGTLTITKATLTATANPATRTYGSVEPTFTIAYSGFQNGQTASVLTPAPTATTNATINSNVGTYDINPNGGGATNYVFVYVQGVLTITKATLNATADSKSRTYGAANPTFTISYTGFKNGQSATVIATPPVAATTATTTSNVGSYAITVSGGSDINYTFTYTSGTLTIGKAVLLATADNKTRTYGAVNPPFTVTYTGLLGTDVPGDIQTAPGMSTTAGSVSIPGTYAITIAGGTDENYTFNYAPGSLTVGKASLTVKPNNQTRIYGVANPALTISYSGFLNSETVAVIDVPAMSSTVANSASDAGAYNIIASGASDGNYDFVYNPGTLTITKAPLTLTAANKSKVYGAANPPLTITYSGFQNGETEAVLDVPAPAPSTTATVASGAGNYLITISNGTDNNYSYTLVSGILTVTKATLTITADDKTRPFNTANPPLTVSYSGFMNSDNVSSIVAPTISTSAVTTSPVNTYAINVSGGAAVNYTFTYVSGTLTVVKATPVVTWATPAAITYGTPLGAGQLNATSPVVGSYVYSPVPGTVLSAGAGQILTVNFTPSDLTNYNIPAAVTVSLTVNKATPVISWPNPAAITYGTALNTVNHLNATANVPGGFTYTPVAGTILNAGVNQALKADFHPTDVANYNDVLNVTRQITVNKATPTITWANPAPITYGTALSATQLNASFSVPGTKVFVPGAGTILPAGANQAISVNFTPTDAANYNSITGAQVLITVLKATPVVSWANPADISYGTPLTLGAQLNATSAVAGTYLYNPAPGTILSAGASQTLTVGFTPTDQSNYNSVPTTAVVINVTKANPGITWGAPAPITYGTALSATQLNPTSGVPGSFNYNPAMGTVLNAGANQTLAATFTPTDQANYNTIVTNRTITVNKATPVVTWANPAQIVYGTPLSSTQQNASANVPGTYDYTPAAGTILTTGASQNISVKFTPTDQANYNTVLTTTAQITVIKATPVITWAPPLPIKVGVALQLGVNLNANSTVPGSFIYTPAAGTSFGTDGIYTLRADFTPDDAVNYNSVANTTVQLTVSAKDNPVITWNDPAAITYGAALTDTPGGQLVATASVPGSTVYDPPAGTKLNAGAGQNLKVTFTPNDLVNYNSVSKTVHINVNKATLTATATSTSRAYGATNPVLNVTYTGFVNGDNETVIDTKPTATCAAIVSDAAGSTFPIVPSGGIDNNYQFTYANGTLTINKALLTATADNQSRAYGFSNPDFTISYSGFANGDDAGDITPPTASTTALITSNVGSYPITLAGGAASNYTFQLQAGSLSVTKAILAVISEDQTKAYGDVNPTLTLTYLGFKNGDTKTNITQPTASTTATVTSAVGTYPINIAGGSAQNYSLTFFPGSLTVTKATLTAIADDKTRVYGQANPSNHITYSGFRNGDTEALITQPTFTPSTADPASDAGTYPIQLAGGSAVNYDITLQNGTLTVTKAILTATAQNQSRAYGLSNPAFTTTYTGFLNGDDKTEITEPTGSTTATIASNAGNYPITLIGGSATNYTFNFQSGTLTITKVVLQATANDATRTYGQSNPIFGISYNGFVNSDDTGDITQPTASTTATPASNAGNYAITLAGGSATNYSLSLATGTLTVAKASLTAKPDNKTRLYGAANPTNTVSYTGFVNGDDASDVVAPSFVGPAATPASPVGDYTISLSGGSANNYILVPQNGTLTITKAPLTAKADDKSRTYGGTNPPLTISYTGFVNGENASNITVPVATTAAVATSDAGTYPITLTGTTSNYAFTFVSGTLTVNKATLTVTAENKTRIYGVANPAFTLTYSGFMNSETPAAIDQMPTASTVAIATTPVQNIAITVGGGNDHNYTFAYVPGTLSITKAPLTATADNKTRAYGSANPANTISYTGFMNGEGPSAITQPTANTSATTTSPVGTYPIVVSGGSATNYQITPQNGTLTITKALLTVTASNQSRSYGSANPTLSLIYAGFVNAQGVADIDQLPTATTTATITSSVGIYSITASGGTDGNYGFSYVPGTLTVNRATLTATADPKTATYGTMPPLTITWSGFANGEDVSVIDSPPAASTSATITSDTGTYPIDLTSGTDNNYTIVSVAGTLTLGRATITATADDKARIIGFANPPLTISYSGFMNNETIGVINTLPTASTLANAASAPGNYSIDVSGGSDDHYAFTYQAGSLLVVLDTPPVVKNFQVETDEDIALPFDLPTFTANYTDEPGGKIVYVKIATLPQNGVLFKGLNSRVVVGEELPVTNGQLGELLYIPNSNYAGTDAFTWNVFDGTFPAASNATVTIKIKPVNDPPVLSNIESTIISYNPGDPEVKLTEEIIINDIDDDFAFAATVSVASNFTKGDELSVILPQGSKIELTYNETKGELTLDGKDTRTNYQSLLRNVTFNSPVNGEAAIGNKTINIVVKDSVANSNIASRTILISQVFPELDLVNAFTPNDDGVNDAWDILNLQSYTTIDINVYDLNSNRVFKCTTNDCTWDGTFKGKALPAGPYAYTIDLDNGKRTYKGIVTILK